MVAVFGPPGCVRAPVGPQNAQGAPVAQGDLRSLFPDLELLSSLTLGVPQVCLAVLDGPVDLSHPCFRGAGLAQPDGRWGDGGKACEHGTHIASVIFGQPSGPVRGIAPRCRGLSLPIFSSGPSGAIWPCSQVDLAAAIAPAAAHGAHVINVSGGEFTPSGEAHAALAEAVAECVRRGILIVAAAGNEGCACLHVPAALPGVLAVGAMDAQGEPLALSNWGRVYDTAGILAPGERIVGARPGGGTAQASGTSCAAAVVSGVVGLLLSWQHRRGLSPDPQRIREVLLATALGCSARAVPDCRRLLAGRLNVTAALAALSGGIRSMTESIQSLAGELVANAVAEPPAGTAAPSAVVPATSPSQVQPAACACQGGSGAPQLAFVLGQLGYDLVSEARLDYFSQRMSRTSDRFVPHQATSLLEHLGENSWDAAAIEWTLVMDGNPVYAIRPQGPFAADTYQKLQEFLRDQLHEQAEQRIERVSIPGRLAGKATLLSGQVVPVLVPERGGMYSWTTQALIDAVIGPAPAARAAQEVRQEYQRKQEGVRDFLERVYHELRNPGISPQDRALNYAATNVFQIREVFAALQREREPVGLESVRVERSPVCRPHSDCWDVVLYFFYPARPFQTVRKVYRVTVDVSEVVPVTVGPIRSWSTR
jgi:hypothetical protein